MFGIYARKLAPKGIPKRVKDEGGLKKKVNKVQTMPQNEGKAASGTNELDRYHIMSLARLILSNERVAVQNAEFGREKVVYKYQDLADKAMQELADYLGQSVRP